MWSLSVFQFHYIGEYLMIVLAKLFYRCRPLTSQRFNAMQFCPAKLLQDRSALSEHFTPCSGPVLGFSWYWIQICWNSVPGVTINFPCDQAPGWMTEFRNIKFLTRTKSLKQKFTQRKARKSTKFRHINPIKPDIEDSSGALRGAPETNFR